MEVLRFSGTARVSAGSGLCYMRRSIGGFDTTSSLYFGSTTTVPTRWYVSLPSGESFSTIPAGSYTVKMQLGAESGSTVTLLDYVHGVFTLGA